MTEPELHGYGKGKEISQEMDVDVGENKDQNETSSAAQSSSVLPSQRSRSRPRPGTRPRRFQLTRSLNTSLYGSSVGSAPSVEDDGDSIVTSMQLPSKTYTESLFSPPPPPTPVTATATGSGGLPTVVVSIHEDAIDSRQPKAEAREEAEERREESEEPKCTQAKETDIRYDLYDDSVEDNDGQLAFLQDENAKLRGENAQLHDLFNAINGELEETMLDDSELQDALAEDAAANPRSVFRDGSNVGSQREATDQYLDNQGVLGPLTRLVYLVKQFCRIRKWQREQQKAEQSAMAFLDDPESLDNLGSPGLYNSASRQSMQLQDVWQDLPDMMVQQSLSESAILTGLTLSDVLDTGRPFQAEGPAVTSDGDEEADEDRAKPDGLYDGSSHGSLSDNGEDEDDMNDTEMPETRHLTRVHENDDKQDVVPRGQRSSTISTTSKTMPGSAEERTAVRELNEKINRISNERDEALEATEHAMAERDVALDEREQFSQENEKLRTVLALLVEGQDDDGFASLGGLWPLMEEDEEVELEADMETGHKDEDHVVSGDLQPVRTPETPETPRTPWTKESRRRRQTLRDARAILLTPPPLKSPFPLRRLHTGHMSRRWQRRRNAGVAGSVLDVLQITLHLATAQQWDNLAAVGVWLAVSCGGKDGSEKVRDLWEGLRGGWQHWKQTSRSDSSILPPPSTRPSPLPPPTTSSRNIRDLSLTLSPSPALHLASHYSPQPSARLSVVEPSGRLLTLLSDRLTYLLTAFPADAVAELLISLVVLGCLFMAFCTAAERRLWLDHNADWPRTYLHHHLRQYRPDTCTSTRLSFTGYDSLQDLSSAPSFQWCVCVPAPADPRFVTVPLAEHAAYWRDWASDVVRWILAP